MTDMIVPVEIMKKSISVAPAKHLPEILVAVLKRCLETKVFAGKALHKVVETLEKNLLAK